MIILHHLEDIPAGQPMVLAAGFFDGFHLGHQSILKKAREMAAEEGAAPGILTFYPHPASVLFPERPAELLQSEKEKEETMAALGMSAAVLLRPTKEFLAEPPRAFLAKLGEMPFLRGIVCGRNFTFGKNAEGTAEMMKDYFEGTAVRAEVLPLLTSPAIGGWVISSTEIRRLMKEGDMERAALLLGRPVSLSGDVVHGFRRGTEATGFPTANLSFEKNRVLPRDGVYAVRAVVHGKRYPAVTNVGKNPTFGNGERTVETFVLDFDDSIYGEPFSIEFVKYLRGEIRFPSVEALKEQIGQDIVRAKRLLARGE